MNSSIDGRFKWPDHAEGCPKGLLVNPQPQKKSPNRRQEVSNIRRID